jgi:hypothetical protein
LLKGSVFSFSKETRFFPIFVTKFFYIFGSVSILSIEHFGFSY